MSRFSSIYKQSGPTRRVVQGENTYEKGMYWSNSAIEQGYVHTLLNYEIDSLSYDVHVAGGLHVTDIAPGCTILERATFGSGDADIIVVQSRNQYNLRAFEGITNIISINKLTVKNNQTLEEKLRQQGYTADDVICYKILTYNPINHRLMSVTLIKAERDKYFVTEDGYQLRRLNSNPISCGFSEVWKTQSGADYISNKTLEHPNGIFDDYIPRARRNSYTETFGQKLHSPLYMQTVPNCEGYGNKTFCFTKKKIKNLEGPIKNAAEPSYVNYMHFDLARLRINPSTGLGYQAGDVIQIQTSNASKTVYPQKLYINAVKETELFTGGPTYSYSITQSSTAVYFVLNKTEGDNNELYFYSRDYRPVGGITVLPINFWQTPGVYIGTTILDCEWFDLTITNIESDGNNKVRVTTAVIWHDIPTTRFYYVNVQYDKRVQTTTPTDVTLDNNFGRFVVDNYNFSTDFEKICYRNGVPVENLIGTVSISYDGNLLEDTYLENPENGSPYAIYLQDINTGVYKYYPALLNNKRVPLDAFRYGMINTGCALVSNSLTISTTPIVMSDTNLLWDKSIVDLIKPQGVQTLFRLNLTDGTLKVNNASSLPVAFKALPYLNRNITGQPTTLAEPNTLFESQTPNSTEESTDAILNITDTASYIHPSEWLREDIKNTLRVGQGSRFAAYCTSDKTPTRYLNTLREDPLSSKYYNQEVSAVFVLDYVWNGSSWDFSFIDTSIVMNTDNDLLVESWETTGQDAYGNLITRHYAWLNSLAYTDVLTENNIDNMAEHIVDTFRSSKNVVNLATETSTELVYNKALKPDLNETIDEGFGDLHNQSKLYDTSYAHFEVVPKSLTPSEATRWGYNMLSNTPYTFECTDLPGTETVVLTGFLLKDSKDTRKSLLNPLLNTPGILEFYYNSDFSYFKTPTDSPKYQFTIDYKNPTDEWRTLKRFSTEETQALFASGAPIQVPFTGIDEVTLIRATVIDTTQTVEVASQTEEADQEMITKYLVVTQQPGTLSYTKDATKAQISPEIFDLGSATGMTYWKGRLVLWGVADAENILFLSEPNEPEYFAYPNGIDLFEENIVHVIPYSDALIVFTNTKLWRIDMNADGLSWNKSLLQQNLRLADEDIPYITILKNMLFFKSDKQFYMLVPAKSSTVGELTIAPISKPIKDFLANPFSSIRDIVYTIYPDLAGRTYSSPIAGSLDPDGNIIEIPEYPITDYLVKYGVHTEQNKVMVDWWFDITDWQNQIEHYGDRIVQHDVDRSSPIPNSIGYLPKEYWLVQLIYDTQTYSWTMRTHTSNHIGVFLSDAVNQNTEFINLAFSPEVRIHINAQSVKIVSLAAWGVEISTRDKPADKQLKALKIYNIDLGFDPELHPSYPRFQVFDTGYKEVSSPALKKRFREIQLTFEPDPDTEEGLRATYTAMIDGHTVMSAVSQEIYEETEVDPITGSHLLIKIVDRLTFNSDELLDPNNSIRLLNNFNFCDENLIDPNTPLNYVPLPYTIDGRLSNTFVLDSSALAGVSQVKIRRQINGKGYLVRSRFINITHASYSLAGYAFVSHNKNAR